MTRIGKLRRGYLDLVRDVAGRILENTDSDRISAVFFSSFAPTEFCGIDDPAAAVARILEEKHPRLNAPVHGPYKTGGEALFRALESWGGSAAQPGDRGRAGGDVLVLACEKMTHVDAATAAGFLAPRVNPIEKMYGATLPALGALASRAYMRAYGVPYRAFHLVSVKNHRNAADNPLAHFRTEIGIDEIASSPLVADPLRRHHCAPMSDGAVACLLGEDGDGVSFGGWGLGVDARLFHERFHIGRFRSAALAAGAALKQAGLRVGDIDVVEVHDAFSPFELINLEEMGFYRMGESWRALSDGELDVGGRVAVNPSGGMKARGHPIGVCGLSSVVEIYEQLSRTAGRRQQPGARRGLIQSAGGISRHCYAFVMES